MPTKLRILPSRTTDPRCGKAVDVKKAIRLRWEGKTYYFSSKECKSPI